ncbi:hypothetical protein Y1Q_0008081 [Alligator mississippiensis]|uniref:Uncharacterized protein n=1 Tax=Alligator mississippiensis TaxID=8496 RepID=A0A151NFD4_ALLMI|nr:hypothetical protein Y1Q_0008081 [Alligator mississippiensis]
MDCTLLLQWLVAVLVKQAEDVWAWQAEDVTHEDAQDPYDDEWDQTHQDFQAKLLALECKWFQVVQELNTILGWAVQVMDDDHRVLDSVLALAVMFVPPTAQPLTLALYAPWQPPNTQQQTLAWACKEVLPCLQLL